MIVYTRNSERINNYNIQKTKLSTVDLELYEAVDTINQFEESKKIAFEENMLDEQYVIKYLQNRKHHRQWGSKGLGALGCDLSHILCYKQILEFTENDYCLILEDDAIINDQFAHSVDSIVQQATDLKSEYVHLSCNKRFRGKQYNKSTKLSEHLYNMIPQWHTTAQLVSKRGAEILISKLPFSAPIDISISRHINDLNATSSIINVDNGGAASGGDKNSQFGSLIW